METYIRLRREQIFFLRAVLHQNGCSYHRVAGPLPGYPFDPAAHKITEKEWRKLCVFGWRHFMNYYHCRLEPAIVSAQTLLRQCLEDDTHFRRRVMPAPVFRLVRVFYFLRNTTCPYIPLTLLRRCEEKIDDYVRQIELINRAPEEVTPSAKSHVRCGLTFSGSDLECFIPNQKIRRTIHDVEHYSKAATQESLPLDEIMERLKKM